MPPMYPKMRERPLEFRTNQASRLYDSLAFAALGRGANMKSLIFDSGPLQSHGTLVGADVETSLVWFDELNRWGIYADSSANRFVNLRTPVWTPGEFTYVAFVLGNVTGIAFDTQGFYVLYRTGNTLFFRATGVRSSANIGQLANVWNQWGVRRDADDAITFWLNGTSYVPGENPHNPGACTCTKYMGDYSGYYLRGPICDGMIWRRALSQAEMQALADPFNIDLRIGGIPLILPPRRRFWPVVSEQAVPKMVPWHLFQQVSA